MNWLLEPLHHEFLQRALLVCALVGFTNGFLSAYVVLRRMALLTDALAHTLFPGVVVGWMLFGLAPLGLLAGGLVAALLVALGGVLIGAGGRVKEEIAIGVLFTTVFALGLALVARAPGQIELGHYLFGNVLGVQDADLWTCYAISFAALATLITLQRPLLLMLLEPATAKSQGVPVGALGAVLVTVLVLCMLTALQAVGVILALSLLIAPAATVLLYSNDPRSLCWGGGALGALGACGGLLLSYWTDIPPGACIVLLLGSAFLISCIVSPRYGVASRWRTRRQHFHEASLARWGGGKS